MPRPPQDKPEFQCGTIVDPTLLFQVCQSSSTLGAVDGNTNLVLLHVNKQSQSNQVIKKKKIIKKKIHIASFPRSFLSSSFTSLVCRHAHVPLHASESSIPAASQPPPAATTAPKTPFTLSLSHCNFTLFLVSLGLRPTSHYS